MARASGARRRGNIASIGELAYRLRSFKGGIRRDIARMLKENNDLIVSMIADGQLYERGVRGNGRPLPDYSPGTIKRKQKKGQRYDHMTLRDTGKFHKSLWVHHTRTGFVVESGDPKAERILKKYGDSTIRLSRENLTVIVREVLRPGLKEIMLNKIKNG